MDDSLVSRYNCLAPFKQRLDEFKKFNPRKLKTKSKKRTVYSNAKKLYSKLLRIYYDDNNDISDEEKEKMGEKYNLKNLLLMGQRFAESKKEEKSKSQPAETIAERVKLRRQKADDKDLFDMSLPSTDDDSDEFNDILDMPPLGSDG